MTRSNLTLFADNLWISPYGFSSFVALREKSLAFNVVEVSLIDGAHLSAPYQEESVTARIPSIRHDGFTLAESSAIAEYLEEAFPPPQYAWLLPENLRDRARARQLMAWLRSDLDALRQERSTITMFYRLKVPELSSQGVEAANKLLRVSQQLILPDAGPLFGAWSLVDIELSFMLHRLILNGHSLPPRVLDYAKAQWERPSVAEFVRHARPAAVPERYWSYSGLSPLEAA
jgi:glutathione S-transferase